LIVHVWSIIRCSIGLIWERIVNNDDIFIAETFDESLLYFNLGKLNINWYIILRSTEYWSRRIDKDKRRGKWIKPIRIKTSSLDCIPVRIRDSRLLNVESIGNHKKIDDLLIVLLKWKDIIWCLFGIIKYFE